MFTQLLPHPILGFGLISGVVSLFLTIFWLWMLIDCFLNPRLPGVQKIIWALVIFFLPFLGALLYFFLARGSRTTAL